MLAKYHCTVCNSNPSTEKEIFFGCSRCGNKLFKIIESTTKREKNTPKTEIHSSKNNVKEKDLQFTSISVEDSGIYQINVEKLLNEKENRVVAVSDKDGVIHIKM